MPKTRFFWALSLLSFRIFALFVLGVAVNIDQNISADQCNASGERTVIAIALPKTGNTISYYPGYDAELRVTAGGLTGYNDDGDLSVSGLKSGASAVIADDSVGSEGTTTDTVETVGVAAGMHEFYFGAETLTLPENVRFAASPALADVQAAIKAAHPGDTVIVPSGSATWSSQLVITKSVNLIGAGQGKTVITSGFQGNIFDNKNFLILWNITNDKVKSFRLSGFTLDAGDRSALVRIINNSLTSANIRIDHVTFQGCGAAGRTNDMLNPIGLVWGCCDNCIFNPDASGISGFQRICMVGYQSNSWKHTTFEFGSEDQFYFEDNTFYWNRGYIWEGGGGGRYAVRHNKFYNRASSGGGPQFADAHGNYLKGNYSTMGLEMYENTINLNTRPSIMFSDLRGGKALIYNNHFVGRATIIPTVQIREEGPLGPSHMDGYDGSPGGRGVVIFLNPLNGQPQHVSDVYIWNTYRNGTKYISTSLPYICQVAGVYETIDYSVKVQCGAEHYSPAYDYVGIVPRNDVHFWREVNGFDGSTGMGSGLMAVRPRSCTLNGAAYWATDASTLYRWRQNSWETFYKPYTYPHPNRSDPVLGN